MSDDRRAASRISRVGRVSLATLPTPVEEAPRLAEAIGMAPGSLLVKRDDLLGLGGGGNKVRKLERTCGTALAAGATVLVTTGAAQSNHARLTAAAGAALGLDVELVLAGDGTAPVVGNLALDVLLGARLHWCGDVGAAALDRRAAERVAELAVAGTTAAQIPYGGSNADGAAAYADAGRELLAQVPDVRHVVVAVGSAGTAAGLVAALGPGRVLGVDTGATDDARERWAALVTAQGIDLPDPTRLRLRTDQVGDGYSALAPGARDALLLAARSAGILLDPIYTARALAGLVAAVAEGDVGPDERTVLLHTGGLPGTFGSAPTMAWAGELSTR